MLCCILHVLAYVVVDQTSTHLLTHNANNQKATLKPFNFFFFTIFYTIFLLGLLKSCVSSVWVTNTIFEFHYSLIIRKNCILMHCARFEVTIDKRHWFSRCVWSRTEQKFKYAEWSTWFIICKRTARRSGQNLDKITAYKFGTMMINNFISGLIIPLIIIKYTVFGPMSMRSCNPWLSILY